jgi:hypothetical protein
MIELKAGMTIVTEMLGKENAFVSTWLLLPINNLLIPRSILDCSPNGYFNLGHYGDLELLRPYITKVYEPIDKLDFGDTDSSLLVWKKEIPEYTIDELKSKIGHKFKIKNND